MSSSETEICNIALSHLGVGKEIANLETEQSEEASACRRMYDIARDSVLRDHEWPFATKIATLNLIETSPNNEWTYSYRYPSDCLKFKKIQSGVRNENNEQRSAYRVAKDATGRLFYSDEENAIGEYTELVTDPLVYPPDFTLALSYKLASLIAPRLTAGDPFGLGKAALQNYYLQVSTAMSNSLNEEQDEKEAESELLASRN